MKDQSDSLLMICLVVGSWQTALASQQATTSGSSGGVLDPSYMEYVHPIPDVKIQECSRPGATPREKAVYRAKKRRDFYHATLSLPEEERGEEWRLLSRLPQFSAASKCKSLHSVWEFVKWYEVTNADARRVNYKHRFQFATGDPTQIHEEGFKFATDVQKFPEVRDRFG